VKSSIQSQSIISSDNNNDIDAEVLKKLQNDDMLIFFKNGYGNIVKKYT
jgi:hypothetical protein